MGQAQLNINMQNMPSILVWDLQHLGDDEFDASLLKFPGWEDCIRLSSTTSCPLPEKVSFEANFKTLATIDYPYNDVGWPIMSLAMRQLLESVGEINCRHIDVTMVDDAASLNPGRPEDGFHRAAVENRKFSAIHLLKHLDVLDWDHTIAEKVERLPHRVRNVKKLALLHPKDGFPPLFRIRAYPIALFVSDQARAALERENIQGVEFVDIDKFRG